MGGSTFSRSCQLILTNPGYEDIHSHLSRFELDTLDLMECLQSVPLNLAKQGDRIASLELPQNLAWLQVCAGP